MNDVCQTCVNNNVFITLTKSDVHDIHELLNEGNMNRTLLPKINKNEYCCKRQKYNLMIKQLLNCDTLFNDFNFEYVLGQGRFGMVLSIYDFETKKCFACKIMKYNREDSFIDPLQEVQIQRHFAKCHVGPKIISYYHKQDIHIIIMEQVDFTLENWMIELSAKYCKRYKEWKKNYLIIKRELKICIQKIINLFIKMSKCKLTHGDMHLNNIAFKNNKIYLIDFGQSTGRFHDICVDIYAIFRDLYYKKYPSRLELLFADMLEEYLYKNRHAFKSKLTFPIPSTKFNKRHDRYVYKAGFVSYDY